MPKPNQPNSEGNQLEAEYVVTFYIIVLES